MKPRGACPSESAVFRVHRRVSEESSRTSRSRMRRCSASVGSTEMHIGTTGKGNLTPGKMASYRKIRKISVGEGAGKLEPCTALGMKSSRTPWNTVREVPEKLRTELPYDPALPSSSGYLSKRLKIGVSTRSLHPCAPRSSVHESPTRVSISRRTLISSWPPMCSKTQFALLTGILGCIL